MNDVERKRWSVGRSDPDCEQREELMGGQTWAPVEHTVERFCTEIKCDDGGQE